MAEVFSFKGIKPAKLKVDAIRMELLNELRKEGTLQRTELKKTVKTWKSDKPKFESLVGLGRGPDSGASVLTGPTGNTKGIKKWNWLDQGTRIRWALMSRNWKSKTRPSYFGSGSGRGRVVIVGRRAMTRRNIKPRPGIEARDWTGILQKRRRQPFTDRMIQAMRRGAQRAF